MRQGGADEIAKAIEIGGEIFAEMHAQGAAAAFGEDVEVAASLGGFNHAERIFLAGDGEIGSVIAGDLQEDSAVWAAFVGLSSGM